MSRSVPDRALVGIAYKIAAIIVFACMDVLIKLLSARYPTFQIIFARNFFAFLPLMILFMRAGDWRFLRTQRLGQHMLRSVFGFSAMIGFFIGIGALPLATVYTIGFAGPILITALSVPLLGEKVGPHRWAAVVVGFIGVLIVLRPGAVDWNFGLTATVTATLFYALAMIQIRKLAAVEAGPTVVFYFTLFCTLASGLVLPFVWVTPASWLDLLMLMGVGILGGTAQILLTAGYRHSDASLLAPFEYSALVWAVVFGWFIFGDWPDEYTWAGSAVLIASGLYILWREVARRRAAAPHFSSASSSDG